MIGRRTYLGFVLIGMLLLGVESSAIADSPRRNFKTRWSVSWRQRKPFTANKTLPTTELESLFVIPFNDLVSVRGLHGYQSESKDLLIVRQEFRSRLKCLRRTGLLVVPHDPPAPILLSLGMRIQKVTSEIAEGNSTVVWDEFMPLCKKVPGV